MRDDVLIVLNEHESRKRERADALQAALEDKFAVHRIDTADGSLPLLVAERNPRILILDYILGEYGTAIDLIDACAAEELSAEVIVWTDEPSAQVAVSVMKLGAFDYIDIDSPRAVEKVVEAISECLLLDSRSTRDSEESPSKGVKAYSLIFEAPLAKTCLQQALAVAEQSAAILVLQGPTGVGRNALARLIHSKRSFAGALHEIDFDLFSGSATEILGGEGSQYLLSHAATVLLDHIESGPGEFITEVEKERDRLWQNVEEEAAPMLIIGTNSIEHAKAWKRLADCTLIEIPSLLERVEDIYPLLQQFLASLPKSRKKPALSPSTSLVELMAQQIWPGNIRQLEATVIEAAAIERTSTTKPTCPSDISTEAFSALTPREQVFLAAALEVKTRWERHEQRQDHSVAELQVRNALRATDGDTRRAAAMLGTSVQRLKQVLNPDTAKNQEVGR